MRRQRKDRERDEERIHEIRQKARRGEARRGENKYINKEKRDKDVRKGAKSQRDFVSHFNYQNVNPSYINKHHKHRRGKGQKCTNIL